MTDKELIGEEVVSTMYGEGEIINVFPEKVEIRFPIKTIICNGCNYAISTKRQ